MNPHRVDIQECELKANDCKFLLWKLKAISCGAGILNLKQ